MTFNSLMPLTRKRKQLGVQGVRKRPGENISKIFDSSDDELVLTASARAQLAQSSPSSSRPASASGKPPSAAPPPPPGSVVRPRLLPLTARMNASGMVQGPSRMVQPPQPVRPPPPPTSSPGVGSGQNDRPATLSDIDRLMKSICGLSGKFDTVNAKIDTNAAEIQNLRREATTDRADVVDLTRVVDERMDALSQQLADDREALPGVIQKVVDQRIHAIAEETNASATPAPPCVNGCLWNRIGAK